MQAQLYTAYTWVCPQCNNKNYCDAVFTELTPEEMAELGIEGMRMGEIVQKPEEVTCAKCYAELPVEPDEGPYTGEDE